MKQGEIMATTISVVCACLAITVETKLNERIGTFRGGTFSWQPTNRAVLNQINISYRIATHQERGIYGECNEEIVKSGQSFGQASLYCITNCTEDSVDHTLAYKCTDFDTFGSLETGVGTQIVTLPETPHTFVLGTRGLFWHEDIAGINPKTPVVLSMLVDLSVRKDKGRVNTSPVTTAPLIVTLEAGVRQNVNIAVRDVDGDIIRCRFATGVEECGDVCSSRHNLNCSLDVDACTISVFPTSTGLHVVAIQIEDFATLGSTTPMSSVPFQFLFSVPVTAGRSIDKRDASILRLVNGLKPTEGRLEVKHNGQWGTVCDDNFDILDAIVACRTLGYEELHKAPSVGKFGSGRDPIWLDEVNCDGNETDFFACAHDPWGNNDCRHNEDVGIYCQPWTDIRLVNGSNPREGRVEVLHGGFWGTVCDDYWDVDDANVVCNQLGFGVGGSNAIAMSDAYFGSGTGEIWLDDVVCNGNELVFFDCQHKAWGTNNCHHFEDAGVICQNDTGFDDAKLLRLVDGVGPSSGRLQVLHNYQWGTVCDDNFTTTDALVVCRMFGFMAFPDTVPIVTNGSSGTGTIWLDEVDCKGNETSFFSCAHNPWGINDCGHSEDVWIVCQPGANIRLVGGSDQMEGRVEIQYRGVWGTVCDDIWTDDNAKVVCSQLNFTNVLPIPVTEAYFGQGTGQIWLDEVSCKSGDSLLAMCAHDQWRKHDCQHNEDAGVICLPHSGLLQDTYKYQLEQWIGEGPKQFTLLFSAIRDNCSAAIFHTLCDNKGPTVTLLYNKARTVYGAYASSTWTSNGSNKFDNNTFLFSMQLNGTNLKFPPIHDGINHSSILDMPEYGPTFGANPSFISFIGNITRTQDGFDLNSLVSWGNDYETLGLPPKAFNNAVQRVIELQVYRVTAANASSRTDTSTTSTTGVTTSSVPTTVEMKSAAPTETSAVPTEETEMISTPVKSTFPTADETSTFTPTATGSTIKTTTLVASTITNTIEVSIVQHISSDSDVEVYSGHTLALSCTLFTNVSDSHHHVISGWQFNGTRITAKHGSRIQILKELLENTSQHRLYNLSLTIANVLPRHAGRYGCYSETDMLHSNKTVIVEVIKAPEVVINCPTNKIKPLEQVYVTCRQSQHKEDTTFLWTMGQGSGKTMKWFLGPDRKTVNVNETTLVSCKGRNGAGDGTAVSCLLEIDGIAGPNICPTTFGSKYNITWTKTLAGNTVFEQCPSKYYGKEYTGNATRRCSIQGKWEDPQFNCISSKISGLLQMTERLKDGTSSESLTSTLDALANVTKVDPTEDLGEGDIQAVTDILDTAVSISISSNKSFDDTQNQTENFLAVVSNVMDKKNTASWKALNKRNNAGATKVLQSVDKYLGALGSLLEKSPQNTTQSGSTRQVKTFKKPNLVAQVARTKPQHVQVPKEDTKEILPEWTKKSTVSLQKETLHNLLADVSSKEVSYSAAFFKDISGILPSAFATSKSESNVSDLVINSNIVAFQLRPSSNTILNPPVSLTFDHSSSNLSDPVCAFWDFEKRTWSSEGCTFASDESNSTQTVCHCNHLTNFAILMSPMKTPTAHVKALSIISAVGCAVSLFCLLVTIIVHVPLWRYIRLSEVDRTRKVDRPVILMNLCFALMISYVVFLVGVNRTETEVLCTVIAALLHYFFLVVFFLMLAEGIGLLTLVTSDHYTKSNLRWMLPISWGAPAVIVGVSLGVTKLEGFGNEDNCWLSIDNSLLWAFVGPVLAVILANLVIIVIVFKKGIFSSEKFRQKSDREKLRTCVRDMCILLPILGVTWILGVFSINEDLILFEYLFVIFNSLQGVFIFVIRVLLDKKVRKGFVQVHRKWQSRTSFVTNTNKGTTLTTISDARHSLSVSKPPVDTSFVYPQRLSRTTHATSQTEDLYKSHDTATTRTAHIPYQRGSLSRDVYPDYRDQTQFRKREESRSCKSLESEASDSNWLMLNKDTYEDDGGLSVHRNSRRKNMQSSRDMLNDFAY